MSIWGKDPSEWLKRFGFTNIDFFKEFDNIRQEMEKFFEYQFKNVETGVPKNLVREYETKSGDKVREFGPFIYGYSVSIGPDGKPKFSEFGNLKSPMQFRGLNASPVISSEIEPLSDVIVSDDEVIVTIELPGVSKEDIEVSVVNQSLDVKTKNRKVFHKVIKLPESADASTGKSKYNNGILEVTFKKIQDTSTSGTHIPIE